MSDYGREIDRAEALERLDDVIQNSVVFENIDEGSLRSMDRAKIAQAKQMCDEALAVIDKSSGGNISAENERRRNYIIDIYKNARAKLSQELQRRG